MTTDPPVLAPTATPRSRRRPRQAPAARLLATGAALSATGILVAVMGADAAPTLDLASTPPPASVVGSATPPPTTIVIVHRPASGASSAAASSAPSAGRAVPAPRPVQLPAPVTTSSAS